MKPIQATHSVAARRGLTPKPTIVTLAYHAGCTAELPGAEPYRIIKIQNDICVQVRGGTRRYHVGDHLQEAQASELTTEPNVDLTVIPAK